MTKTSMQAVHMALGQLYTNEVTDARILQAMVDVSREAFVPDSLKGSAYVDEDIRIKNGRYLPEPLTMARMLDLCQIAPESRVLVVGALNGYAAALCARLAQHVVAIESDAEMLESARTTLEHMGIRNVDYQQVKSMADGYALSAPYDAIIIAGAVQHVPENLGSQLSIHGRLATVLQKATRPGLPMGLGRLVLVTRAGGMLQMREQCDTSAALLPGFSQESGFSF